MDYLIIGNGAAGMDAALAIRQRDPDSSIRMVTESVQLHYYRPKLIEALAQRPGDTPLGLLVHDEAFYAEKRIENVLGARIVSLDPGSKTISDASGRRYAYDRLLIASGSRPFLPPVEGIGKEGVFTLRSIEDVEAIRRHCERPGLKEALVVGGGLLGLESAHSLLRLGMKVTVLEFASSLLPRQLDAEGAGHLRSLLEAKGLRFVLGDQVARFEGGPLVEGALLKSGKALPASLVLVSAGVRPELSFAQASGLAVNKGAIVDDYLRTNLPDVWAAGDAAEHRAQVCGLWTVAKEQGRAAGLNMAGLPTAYEGSVPSTLLKITGIDLFSSGDPKAAADRVLSHSGEDSYRKVLIAGGKVIAVMIVGDREAARMARKVMAGEVEPESLF